MDQHDEARGTSRREALKRAAAVGAVAWTAPIVSTFNTPAFGQTVVSPSACPAWDCGDPQFICGNSGPLDLCLCDQDTSGTEVCWENISCGDSRVVPCTSNADCLPGWVCTTNCCGQTCLPKCGTNHVPASNIQSESTATAAG